MCEIFERRWSARCAAWWVVAVFVAACWSAPTASADVWTTWQHSDLQRVDADGFTYWTGANQINDWIVMKGIVINNPADMLDYSNQTSSSPQWQTFIQAVEPGDYGGTALYMRREKPFPGHPGSLPYNPEKWDQEMVRLNYPDGVSEPLQRGDLIEVYARGPGLFHRGKFNVNEKHNQEDSYDFDIKILERGLTPDVSLITLSDLMDGPDTFRFDPNRAFGPEHYQGSLVRLEGLSLLSGNWAADGTVRVGQDDLAFDLKLGLDPSLFAPELLAQVALNPFSVTAIMDQEEPGTSDKGWTIGYRLWLTNAGDLEVVPEPGTWLLALLGGLLAVPIVRRHNRSRGR